MEKNTSISRDLKQLRKKVKRLKRTPLKRFENAVCDIIDLKGYGVAVLLRYLPIFGPERQKKIVQKIEDFLYFHPSQGVKIFPRLKRAYRESCDLCNPHLLAAMVDVSAKMKSGERELRGLLDEAKEILDSQVDYTRKGKALEIIARADKKENVILIIKNMILAVADVAEFANYHFIENGLLVLKRLGGDSILCLLINPNSDNALSRFRMEWRDSDPELVNEVYKIFQTLDEDFSQTMLKVVDLSDFNLPFVSMIKEGTAHPDKWVRQAAVASMEKATAALSHEILARMLNDSSPEVRLVAIASLGGYSIEQTGEIIEALAERDSETVGSRMNALYALYSQKNLAALERVSKNSNSKIALNAIGLSSLLKRGEESFDTMFKVYWDLRPERGVDLEYYLLELSDPEYLKKIVEFHKKSSSALQKEACFRFLELFMQKKAGPRLERAKLALTDGEKKALQLLSGMAE